jgi:ABC-type nitrate/sulfonate/bicarbonate transport system ATPase subunit
MSDTTQLDATLVAVFSQPSGRPLALLGPSGSGKTTLLRHVSARVEHLEDLRDKPLTQATTQRLLEHAARSRPVLLTLTRSKHDAQVSRWLRSWTELLSIEPPPGKPPKKRWSWPTC